MALGAKPTQEPSSISFPRNPMASAACAQFTAAGSCRQAPACGRRPAKLVLQAGMGPRSRRGASSRTQQQLRQQQQQPRPCQRARAAAAEGAAPGGVPPGWEKANRVSADALAMLTTGETNMAELILKKGGQGRAARQQLRLPPSARRRAAGRQRCTRPPTSHLPAALLPPQA